MIDFEQRYRLWEEFLAAWPASRLATMSLDEYCMAGSQDCFTYWMESRLDKLGSIWGGSAFKFGVYSRKATEAKTSDGTRSYSSSHGWTSSLGATAQEAFDKVRGHVTHIAQLASQGDLDGIEAFKQLGEAYKWKIAFHYQNRQTPLIVNIFKRAPLAVDIGDSASRTMAALQTEVMARKPDDLRVLEFGHRVWEAWTRKNLTVWKLSHGNPPTFTDEERERYLRNRWAVMHRDTSGPGPGAQQKGKQGGDFNKAPVGTLFYLCHGNSPQLIGQLTSGSIACDKDDGWLQRSYRVLKAARNHDRYTVNSKNWSPQGNSTFWQVNADELPEFESTLLEPYFDIDLAELAEMADEAVDAPFSPAESSSSSAPGRELATIRTTAPTAVNRIYYGPPGTGKTRTLNTLARNYQDASYEALSTQEWRAQFVADRIAGMTWWEGAVAALYLDGAATIPALSNHPFIVAIAAAKGRTSGIKQTLWGTLQHHTVLDSKTVNIQRRMEPAVFDKTASAVWGLSGNWKESCADVLAIVDRYKDDRTRPDRMQRCCFVTFHQSYGYEEFVEGLRPMLLQEDGSGDVAYEIRAGVFKELCRKARQVPTQRFAMVIDEINRGNISKIFGELITLIEIDKRDPLDGTPAPIEVTLAYSGEKFSVPANVDIFATMNTADRSLALLDTALRRRFEFVPLMPDTRAEKDPADPDSAPLAGLVVTTDAGKIDVRRMLHRINERIEAIYDRDHSIGHAYLTGMANVEDGQLRFEFLAATFRNRIVPLLEEYFFEDWRKIRLVLADNQKSDPTLQFILENTDHEQDLPMLFGRDHGLDSYATKRRYSVQDSAFHQPMAYLHIYLQQD